MTPPEPPSRLFRLVLRLYPRAHRERYGEEMEALFRREREAAGGGPVFWVRLVADHLEAAWALRTRATDPTGREDGTMGRMTRWVEDVRSAWRALVRAPGFALSAVGTLALGVGAMAAVFTVTERVVLRPLPYPGSERMALVGIDPRHDPGSLGPLSPALLTRIQEAPGPAEAVVAVRERSAVLQGATGPERVEVTEVSRDLFGVLGARAAAGRLLRQADHDPGAPPVVVLGHTTWVDRWGGDPSVVGRTLRLDGDAVTVVGVLDDAFLRPPELVETGDFWRPLEVDPQQSSSFFLAGMVRLRPGADLAALDAHLDARIGGSGLDAGVADFILGGSARSWREAVVGPVGGTLGRVLAAVFLLLAIACVNVAGLLLTRGARRRHELGVHAALGAPRSRLVGKLLAESALLALAGGLVGTGLAWGAVELFRVHAPAGLPRLAEVALDGRGLAFALGLAGLTVLGFGLLPALRSTRGVGGSLASVRGSTPGRREGRVRGALVAAETALAVILAVGSGLLAHDLARTAYEDAGFRPEGLVAVTLDLAPRVPREEWATTWERLMEETAAVPGASSVAVATQAPYDGSRMASTYRPEGQPADAEAIFAITVAVGGDYLDALGTRLVEGRAFTPDDDDGEPVALVNEAFVARFWPGERGVGKRVRSGEDGGADYRVVGVLADVRTAPGQAASPHVFPPLADAPWRQMEVLARTTGDASALVPGLREAVRRVDPSLPVSRIRTLDALASDALAAPRFYAWLFGGFAGVALLLAVVGVWGTTSYATRARLREMGIRRALGARRGQVVARVVARAGLSVGLGVLVGLGGAALASRALADSLNHVDARDLPTYLAVALAVTAAGVVAAWIPAGAAGRVDPVATLRQE